MRSFVLYTLARLGLFLAAFALIWLVAFQWLPWNATSVLSTAVLAMIASAIASVLLLRRLRERFAVSLQQRAAALREGVDRSRNKEDAD